MIEAQTNDLDAERPLRALLDQAPPGLAELVRRVTPRHELQFSVIASVAEGAPVLNFSSETVKRIAALGGSIDIDLYFD